MGFIKANSDAKNEAEDEAVDEAVAKDEAKDEVTEATETLFSAEGSSIRTATQHESKILGNFH